MSDFLLHELAVLGDWKQMEVLFRVNGVKDIDLRDNDFEGQTALHWAVRRGKLKCCQVLLEQGADPTLKMHQGWTVAHCAAEFGHLDILKLLLEYSVEMMTVKDISGATPKHIAEVYGHHTCVSYFNEIESDGPEADAKRKLKDFPSSLSIPEKQRPQSSTLTLKVC